MYIQAKIPPTSPAATTRQSDVSVDRRAARGHETLDKGHACPLTGKSSMHSFPAIVLQPGVQISLVQVEPFPSYSLSQSHSCSIFFSL